jgi:hypothetical protein
MRRSEPGLENFEMPKLIFSPDRALPQDSESGTGASLKRNCCAPKNHSTNSSECFTHIVYPIRARVTLKAFKAWSDCD